MAVQEAVMSVSASVATSVGYYTGGGGVASGRVNYYVEGAAPSEPPGQWYGELAESLGLTGEVDGDVMEAVYGDWTAPDGTKLGRNAPSSKGKAAPISEQLAAWKAENPAAMPEEIEQARARIESESRNAELGLDLTFGLMKTVSIEHAALWREELAAENLGKVERMRGRLDRAQSHFDRAARFKAGRETIEEAMSIANQAMMDFATELAVSRVGRHGATGVAERWIDAKELAWASFTQHTNRSIQPHLHAHDVALNRTRCADGEIRALDTKDLMAQRHALGALADRVLMEALSARGMEFEMRQDGRERPQWESKNVGRDLVEVSSERAMTIRGKFKEELERVEKLEGRELTDTERWRLRQEITLSTRARKTGKVPDAMTVLRKIQDEIKETLGRDMRPLAEKTVAALERGQAVTAEVEWSPDKVCREAVAALSEKNPTWRWADLLGEIQERVPYLGGRLAPAEMKSLLVRLTDRTIDDPRLVTQTSGREGIDVPHELGGPGVYVRPTERRFASTGSVAAELAIRDAAAGRGAHHLKGSAVDKALDAHEKFHTMGVDQRAVINGVTKSDARLVRVEAPAGAGKSFMVGGLSYVWEGLSKGGRVIGLAPSTRAAQVLASSGVAVTANIDQFLGSHKRLHAAKGLPTDSQFKVGPKDIVIVDEASMVSRAHFEAVHDVVVRERGARLVIVGDPQQLSSVQAGDVLGILDGHCETHYLEEIRRFDEPWEAAASIRFRAGDLSVLPEYDRRGRIVECKNVDEALERAARDVAADLLFRDDEHANGYDSMVIARTNQYAEAAASAIREYLVKAGEVRPELGEVRLEKYDGLAAKGDRVACRDNDHRLGVTNRRLYTVIEAHEDGGLTVMQNETGEVVRLPKSYVEESVSLAYAGTKDATQGVTLDRSRPVFDGQETRADGYVPLTRGSELNVAYVSLNEKDLDPSKAAQVEQFRGPDGQVVDRVTEFDKSREFQSGVQVLEAVLRREGEVSDAALVWMDRDDARLKSMSTILGWREDAIQHAQRGLLNGWLDELTSVGLMSEADRGRAGADQGMGYLTHLLRAVDQAGEDPKALLTSAVLHPWGFTTQKGKPVESIGRVLSDRIERAYQQAKGQKIADAPPVASKIPAGLSAQMERHLERLDEAADNRRRELGTELAENPPTWALRSFGPVPEDPTARLGWEHRAGLVAGFREATGFQDERRPIGEAPGISSTERRALWDDAYTALGRPESRRTEARMSTEQLRARVRAWEREKEWAPKHANDASKEANRSKDVAHVANVHEGAGRLENQEQIAALGAEAEARDAWWAETAETRGAAQRAEAVLLEREEPVEPEPEDLTTATEWLAAQREAEQIEEPHRTVTEVDVVDEVRDRTLAEGVEERAVVSEPVPDVDRRWQEFVAKGVDEAPAPVESFADKYATPTPDADEMAAAYDRAARVEDEIRDRESLEESAGDMAIYDLPYDMTPEPAPVEAAGPELVAEL